MAAAGVKTRSAPEASTAGRPWGCDVLDGLRALDLSSGLTGAVCTKVFADAGAAVIKVEDPGGDPLRRWSATGDPAGPGDGLLFRHLGRAKQSLILDADRPLDRERLAVLASAADLIVWSAGSALAATPDAQPGALAAANPRAVVCAISPFGLAGPWAERAASELTLQAWGGGIGYRGPNGGPPVTAGGRVGEWTAGLLAAVSALAALDQRRLNGRGDLIDVSILESVMTICAMAHPVAFRSVAGRPMRQGRVVNIPGVHRASDGWGGFMVLTGQQWQDFCLLVEQPEWLADDSLLHIQGRLDRHDEIMGAIDAWMGRHTLAEVLERAALFRVPAGVVANGATTPTLEQVAALGLVAPDPSGGFLEPQPPYRFSTGKGRKPGAPAPRLGEHRPADAHRPPPEALGADAGEVGKDFAARGLSQLRIADLTSFWAGTIPGRYLAMAGADVIRIESPGRLDGFRYASLRAFDQDDWWEWAPLCEASNLGKRHLSLDLSDARGRDVLLRLVRHCDVLVENYTPRVLENWGLSPERLLQENPSLIVLRMPGFGLEGPWRDRPGFAQVMEMFSGMAWGTGFADGEPVLPNGQVDPIGGHQALIALLLGLEQRRRTGKGLLIEAPLLGGALAVAAEQIIEHSAHGVLLSRQGNRHPSWAPQGVYPCAGASDEDGEGWIALSIADDAQWEALKTVLGRPAWAEDATLAHAQGRRAAHDRLDRLLEAWTAERTQDEVVELLWSRGVPVARVVMPHTLDALPQVQARGFYELVGHPLTGESPQATFPAVTRSGFGAGGLRPAPLFGQHNQDILGGLLGMTPEEIDALKRDGVIGDRPR
ncbi:MAG: CoA transferase [Caulobacteraceae bacterium]|nr:CoA transferase [Caulobacteraceae bacterium]